ncbi:efflux RND transporter periplasmic adaptor subunit [Alteromonas sp. A081]|uniref:efflux RND transporter periplasmic adaptor subunit n=1 Tax=Alteromonas sp. A081 TaxID=3410269 RepID=UPI003B984A91
MSNSSSPTKPLSSSVIALIIGVTVGSGALLLFQTIFQMQPNSQKILSTNKESDTTKENTPLYWVAPMDANYRRDEPGKSPMGMDLVPVYEESGSSDDFGKGAIKIAPNVVNNLGVRTAPVERKAMGAEIVTVGYVQYDEDEIVHIHPRVEGWIETLYVKAKGDYVEKGAPLYTLYSPQLVNAQEELITALKRNNNGLVKAAKDRLKALQIPQTFISELESTRKVKQNITFYAPQSGVLDGLNIREGFFVKPANTLLSIAKLNKIWVEAEVFERDVILMKKGLQASMTLDYLPRREWIGKVDYIYPALNASTRTLRVRLEFDNADNQLKPNMFASVRIYVDQAKPTIVVPKEAVIRTGDQDRVVLALGEGQFKSISVDIGLVRGDSIEILNGLNEGDDVVTSAQFLIDSESSKSSDFTRMASDKEPRTAWMEGEINSVMAAHRMVNITHGPAEAWGWPAMTMDFMVADSVDIATLKAGQTLHFEATKANDNSVAVTGIHIMSEPEVSSATVTGVINDINISTRIINISRGAIEKWGRPPATMDFTVAGNIDLTRFSVGDTVNFTFEIREDFIVVAMTRKSANPPSKKPMHKDMSHEEMSHENMSHEDMNHEDVRHENMNHKAMNHKAMNHD